MSDQADQVNDIVQQLKEQNKILKESNKQLHEDLSILINNSARFFNEYKRKK